MTLSRFHFRLFSLLSIVSMNDDDDVLVFNDKEIAKEVPRYELLLLLARSFHE